jgi:hypothetical protein
MVSYVLDDDGTELAWIERVKIGGGTQTVTVDGVPEERQHPSWWRYHVRLISPDRMIPDTLHEAETYDEAVAVGVAYGRRRIEHAGMVDELAKVLHG